MYYRSRSTFYLRNFGFKFLLISILAVVFLFGTYSYITAARVTPEAMMMAVRTSIEDYSNKDIIEQNASVKPEVEKIEVAEKPQEDKPAKVEAKKEEIKQTETVKEEQPKETKPVKENKVKSNFTSALFSTKENKLKYTKHANIPLKDLKSYKISGAVKVLEVIDANKLVIEDIDSTKYTVNLIGVTGLDETKYSREGIVATIDSLNEMLVSKNVQIEFDIEKNNADKSIDAYVYFNKGLLNADMIAKGYCDIKVETTNTNKIGDLLLSLKRAKASKLGIWNRAN